MHFVDNIQLALPVALRACHENAVYLKLRTVGVVQRGVVGNGDQRGAFRDGQLFHFLAEILGRRGLHAGAALAQVDPVQILFHDYGFVVSALQIRSFENFRNLTLHSYRVIARNILYKLLCNCRAAPVTVAEEHKEAGFEVVNQSTP